MSSEDTEHLLVTLDTADQHQSLSGRPAAEAEAALCCGDTSQIPRCENLSGETFWLKGSPYLTCYKSCVPVTKAGPLCLPSGLCRGQLVAGDTRSSAVPQQEPEQLFYDKSAILLLVTATTHSQSAVFSGNLLYQKYNFHASKNWRKVGAVRNASILCL